jgi:hypothetical protein
LLKKLSRKLAVASLLIGSAIGAFATLGDGKAAKTKNPHKSLLSNRTSLVPGTFSLKSGYSFRGDQVLTFEKERFINLNSVVTYQKGNTTYIVPLKKKVMLDKITFNPNAATRN